MNFRTKLIGAGILLVSIGLVVASIFFARHTSLQKRVQDAPVSKVLTAEAGTYTDLEGNPLSLKIYKGKPVVVMAWASWCPQCGDQLALLARVAKDVGAGVPLLAINRKESKEMARLYLDTVGQQEGLTYVLDTEDHYFKTSEGYAMPELIIYSADGAEAAHVRGTFTEAEVRALLEEYKGE